MLYNYKEILKKYKSNYNIKKAIKNGQIYKIEKGIYSNKKNNDPLVIFSKKYPNAIITLDSAFYFYHLTDTSSNKTYLATDRNSDTIKNNQIAQVFTDKNKLNQGKTTVIIDGNKVNMYNKERLLVELVRRKNKMTYDYYKEIILNYRDITNELDTEKIENYAQLYKNKKNIERIIRDEVF